MERRKKNLKFILFLKITSNYIQRWIQSILEFSTYSQSSGRLCHKPYSVKHRKWLAAFYWLLLPKNMLKIQPNCYHQSRPSEVRGTTHISEIGLLVIMKKNPIIYLKWVSFVISNITCGSAQNSICIILPTDIHVD